VTPWLFIAWRYLFAKKSHNVINIISAISAVGMSIGTAALILILSVYNGFDKVIKDNISDTAPDIKIVPGSGKTFVATPDLLETLESFGTVSKVIEDNVYVTYGQTQCVARARGVESSFASESRILEHVAEGNWSLWFGDIPTVNVGAALAYSNAIRPHFTDKMVIYYPDRTAKISMSNPLASLETESLKVASIVNTGSDQDNSLIYLPIEVMSELLHYDAGQVGCLELRSSGTLDAERVQAALPAGLQALDRYRQNPSLYKMMRYEKAAIIFILFFVVVIIAFNIFGSLSMLIIEKETDARLLSAMGARERDIRRIFIAEGSLVSVLGMLAGLLIGLVTAYLQQRFGFVKLPGNYLITAYPVMIKLTDVLLTVAGVSIIGLCVSYFSARRS